MIELEWVHNPKPKQGSKALGFKVLWLVTGHRLVARIVGICRHFGDKGSLNNCILGSIIAVILGL